LKDGLTDHRRLDPERCRIRCCFGVSFEQEDVGWARIAGSKGFPAVGALEDRATSLLPAFGSVEGPNRAYAGV